MKGSPERCVSERRNVIRPGKWLESNNKTKRSGLVEKIETNEH